MLDNYENHVKQRADLGIPPLPLDAEQTSELCELLKSPPDRKSVGKGKRGNYGCCRNIKKKNNLVLSF
ncbi:MAG: hypothetical protein F6K34_17315 [Okeania sp. SIO4D6]|nr:hypothetical protein [Okeania sp. SIO4D6]